MSQIVFLFPLLLPSFRERNEFSNLSVFVNVSNDYLNRLWMILTCDFIKRFLTLSEWQLVQYIIHNLSTTLSVYPFHKNVKEKRKPTRRLTSNVMTCTILVLHLVRAFHVYFYQRYDRQEISITPTCSAVTVNKEQRKLREARYFYSWHKNF